MASWTPPRGFLPQALRCPRKRVNSNPNGARIDYTYLTNNWLGTITHKRSGGTIFETLTYAYDANGNRTTLTDATGSTTFGYDQLNRLTSGAYPGTYGTWSWSYDQVGNRLTQNSPSGQTNYGYDANNRLTSAGSTTYSYDNNGNLTSISTGTSFTYDAHNRMSQANLPGGLVVQYTYNGDGLKTRRIEGAATTRYYCDGIRPIYEAKGDGSLNADLERDIFGNLLSRQDAGGTRYYYHHDGLGSTVGLTDASGQVAAQRSYDAWGNRRTSSGSAPGNYQFAGAELDPTSGLYHMGARFYDPTIGRWLGEDPIKGTSPRALNFYAYVGNSPLIFTDLSGACDQACLEELNRERQQLAIASLGTSDPVANYVAAREIARSLEGALGPGAADSFVDKVASGLDPGTVLAEVLRELALVAGGAGASKRFKEYGRQVIEALYWESVVFLGVGEFIHVAGLFFAAPDPRGYGQGLGRNPATRIGEGLLLAALWADYALFNLGVFNGFLCRLIRC